MEPHKPHQLWIEQCEAARTIKARYGITAALDYLISEKLLNFAELASRSLDFARELPRFVSEVRRMFSSDEIAAHLARIENTEEDREVGLVDVEDLVPDDPVAEAERIRQFLLVKELLTAATLGTS